MADKETALDKAKASETFCIYPFSHLATKTEGTFKLCCRSEPVSFVQETSAVELWNSDKYKRIRKQLLNGEKPKECQDCWTLESMGTRSMRQRALRDFPGSRWNEYSPLLDTIEEDDDLPYLPKTLELKLSNLCNLRCRMCHAVDSSSWVKEWPLVDDLMEKHNTWAFNSAKSHGVMKKPIVSAFAEDERWWKDFEKMVGSIDLIEFAGGEPLMDPLHYRILELLKPRAHEIKLKYSTNMSMLEFKKTHVFEYWKDFKSVSIYASVDGIFDVYDYIRTGTRFEVIETNLDSVLQSKDVNFAEVAVACTIQIYNVFQLPQVMRHFSDKGIRFHSHRVSYPAFLNTQVLPEKLKDLAEGRIRDFQDEINSSGLYTPHVTKNLNQHIEDHVKHMRGRDWVDKLPAFMDYTRRLDQSRKTDVLAAVPELRPLYETRSLESEL